MDKQRFLDILSKNLLNNDVEEIGDILAEYEEHFLRKMADGFDEQAIAAKLGDPEEIAAQYAVENKSKNKQSSRLPTWIAFGFADVFVLAFFAIILAWVMILAAAAVFCVLLGSCLIARPMMPSGMMELPYMPYLGGAVLGISCVALGVLLACLTVNCCILFKKLWHAVIRWQKSALYGKMHVPYAIFPLLKNRFQHRMRRIVLTALIVFGMSFLFAFVWMAFKAGNFEFWHVWRWFNYVG